MITFKRNLFLLKVGISLDTTFSVLIKQWKTTYFNYNRALILSVAILAIFLIFNSYILVTFGVERFNNGTRLMSCFFGETNYYTELMTKYGLVNNNFITLIFS